MKDKDYTVKKNTQSGYINIECKPVTELITNYIICGNDVVISVWDSAPKVCDDCKKAIAYAKKLMEKENGK
jgi:hypothetical protein